MAGTILERIEMIKDGKDPYFVAELESGFVVIADHQKYKGYTLFLCKQDKSELHELDRDFRLQFLEDMSIVSEAVYRAFKPRKLNCELLGNTDPHLHWHIIPRYENDPFPKLPIWLDDFENLFHNKHKPTSEELENYRKKLLFELKALRAA